ncbi:MAG: rRNA maturation RNase YbeY [Tateyamaria sp.]
MRQLPHDIDILIEDPRWHAADIEALAARAIGATLTWHDIPAAALSLLACDDARIADLNAEFREKPTPTNVLSWPEVELAPEEDGGVPHAPRPDMAGEISLGDIAIAYDTCAHETGGQKKPFSDHVTHLLGHGTLHLLGYDHIRDQDATRMESLEVEILGKLGLPDPY